MRVWLPERTEILESDTLLNRPLPRSCARCKARNWWKYRKGNVSVARVRALLRAKKQNDAVVALSMADEKNKKKILDLLEKEGYSINSLIEMEYMAELIEKAERALVK